MIIGVCQACQEVHPLLQSVVTPLGVGRPELQLSCHVFLVPTVLVSMFTLLFSIPNPMGEWMDCRLGQVNQVIHPLLQGVATLGRQQAQAIVLSSGFNFFCTSFTSFNIHSSLLLPLFLCLISFLLLPCTSIWENTRA